MPSGVYPRSEDLKLRLRERIIGIAKSRKGIQSHRKGKKFIKFTDEHKRKIGLANKGKTKPPVSDITREKNRLVWLGRKHRPETRRKMALARMASKSHFWKGGKTAKAMIIRTTVEYKLWRESVYKRDKYTCVWCGKIGGKLNADHIKPFALFPELRFAIDNGRTLCVECHKKTDTYGGNSKNKQSSI